MVIQDLMDELAKAKDSLYCARQQGSYERVLMYTETVRVLERILERYYVRKHNAGESSWELD